jgi:hypothetical protein
MAGSILQTSALPLGYRALVKRDRSTPAPQGRRKPKSGDGEIWRRRQTRDAGNRTGWNSKVGEFGEQAGRIIAGRLDGRRWSLVGGEAGDWGNGEIGRWEILGRSGEARCVVCRHTGSPNDFRNESAATAAATSGLQPHRPSRRPCTFQPEPLESTPLESVAAASARPTATLPPSA